jgi:hypothetical protein
MTWFEKTAGLEERKIVHGRGSCSYDKMVVTLCANHAQK